MRHSKPLDSHDSILLQCVPPVCIASVRDTEQGWTVRKTKDMAEPVVDQLVLDTHASNVGAVAKALSGGDVACGRFWECGDG